MRHPDDDLRARLRRLDPAGDLPVDPVTSPRAASHMERAMQTLDTPTAPARRTRLLVGAAVLGAAAAVTAGVLLLGGGEVDPSAGAGSSPSAGSPTTLELSLPDPGTAASCLQFELRYLADMSPAFAGTAVDVGADAVVLDVDRWYAGGDADRVRLEIPRNSSAALDGVDFVEGERYLVTAANGTVNGCGYSGPATPEFERSFEEAFAG
jgi:hypothetical protein